MMTDTGSTMTTLIDRLRAAIDKDHAAIEAYIRHREHGTCVNYPGQDPAGYDEYDTCSEHIATAEACRYRDPVDGRRMVEAHRKIVERHKPEPRWDGLMLCARCSVTQLSVYEEWPCPEIVDLAEGYGIEVSEHG